MSDFKGIRPMWIGWLATFQVGYIHKGYTIFRLEDKVRKIGYYSLKAAFIAEGIPLGRLRNVSKIAYPLRKIL